MSSRREVLRVLAAALCAAPFLTPSAVHARGRTPYGGTLRLHLPFALEGVDPHDLFDLDAAVLGGALFDSLYAADDKGRPYATLADGLPESTPNGLRVMLRAGLKTAAGRSLEAADLELSLQRASRGGARLLLHPFGVPKRVAGRPGGVLFPRGEPQDLARALASPLTAVVPRGFQPRRPDGTGPFACTPTTSGLVLRRNAHAARGGGFLDAIDARRSPDLAAALRAFEASEADLGWLASGLHRARRQARQLDAGTLGWVVMATGRQLGPWAAPGVAQTVLDESPLGSLSALGLTVPSATPAAPRPWRGPATELLVDARTPQLLAIARALTEALGGGGSGITVSPVPSATLLAKRTTGDYGLLLDFVRVIGTEPGDDARALLTAASVATGGQLVTTSSFSSREPYGGVTRRLPLGVVGALRLRGAHLDTFVGLDRWQLGEVYARP